MVTSTSPTPPTGAFAKLAAVAPLGISPPSLVAEEAPRLATIAAVLHPTEMALAGSAYLCSPNAVALDTSVSPANVFISNYGGGVCAVREVVGSSAKIYLVAGNYALGCCFKDNVAADLGQLYDPWQMTARFAAGVTTVAVADYYNARIRQFTLTYTSAVPSPGTLLTVAGKGSGGYCGDNGPALSACMSPVGLCC